MDTKSIVEEIMKQKMHRSIMRHNLIITHFDYEDDDDHDHEDNDTES